MTYPKQEEEVRFLLSSDLHFTDKEEDQKRFEVLDFLDRKADQFGAHAIFILGDLTDSKDNHSAALVNKITEYFLGMHNKTYILKGNHDVRYETDTPFFSFLSHLHGTNMGKKDTICEFVSEPLTVKFSRQNARDISIGMLPHSRSPVEYWESNGISGNFPGYDLIFMHQTVTGSLASNGFAMEGMPNDYFTHKGFQGKVYSGDIHVPQTIGDVTYVGSPYQVRFNDTFSPRILLLRVNTDSNSRLMLQEEDLFFDTVKLHTVDAISVNDLEHQYVRRPIRAEDRVKLRMHIPPSDILEWPEIRKEVYDLSFEYRVHLQSVSFHLQEDEEEEKEEEDKPIRISFESSPRKVLERFCEKENIPEPIKNAGLELIGEDP